MSKHPFEVVFKLSLSISFIDFVLPPRQGLCILALFFINLTVTIFPIDAIDTVLNQIVNRCVYYNSRYSLARHVRKLKSKDHEFIVVFQVAGAGLEPATFGL